jgi:Protein of unknown function (DUF3179)
MMSREIDAPGSISWAPELFAGPPPDDQYECRDKTPWRAVAIGLAVVAAILAWVAVARALRTDSALVAASVDSAATRVLDNSGHPRIRRLAAPLTPVTGFVIDDLGTVQGAIADEEFVVGVEVGETARAYPLNMMGSPESEFLEDTIEGQPIAVTFCNTCQSPLIFSRRVAGETINLFPSGELVGDNMVLQDRETGSKWVQMTGEAIEGPLKGQQLDRLPGVWTDWQSWRTAHPNTTVPRLVRSVQNYQHHELYAGFAPERSFFSKLQWGLVRGSQSRSWPFAELDKQPLANDTFAGRPLLVVFDRKTSTVTAFDRRIGETELIFQRRDGKLTDDQNQSVWDPVTGRALDGPMKGRRLTPIPGTISLDWAWRAFFPTTEIWPDRRAAPAL